MSVTVTTDIFCNKCSNWDADISVSGVQFISIRGARLKAKQYGWIYRKVNGHFEDICPKCQEEEGKEQGDGKQSTRQLLTLYVWGNEPANVSEIMDILGNRGIDIIKVNDEVDSVIKKHSEIKEV